MTEVSSTTDMAHRNTACKVDVVCMTCQRIIQDSSIIRGKCKDLEKKETNSHYESIDELEASAASGCHLCSLIRHAIEPFSSSRPQGDEDTGCAVQLVALFSDDIKQDAAADQLRLYSYYCWPLCVLEVKLVTADGSLLFSQRLDVCRTKYWPLDVRSHGPDDDEWDMLGVNAPDPAQASIWTSSDDCLKLARGWLDTCLHSHRSCNSTGSGFIPTRLLDVGDSISSGAIRLALGNDIPAGTPYLTLSYCWGRGKPRVLTQASLASDLQEIDVTSLPKTIAESVDVTRRLGYRYLWVDSLCIIQDSKEDWKHEASRMGQVYANSILTVAATSSVSNDQGCYKQRNPLSYLPCRISGGPSKGVYVCMNWKSRDLNMLQEEWIQQAPLNTRAWVVQERLLSQRILHFTANGLFWECTSRIANDSCPEGRRVGRTRRVPDNIRFHLRGLLAAPSVRESLNQPVTGVFARMSRMAQKITLRDDEWDKLFMDNWRKVVNLFSRCNITVSTDKKPALAGIVSQICASRGLRYTDGLWYREQLMPHHLLWKAQGPAESLTLRPAARGASTWSWLSVDGEVSHLAQLPPRLEQKEYNDATEWAPYCRDMDLVSLSEVEDDSRGPVLRFKSRAVEVTPSDLTMLNFKPDCALSDPMPETLYIVPLVYRVSTYVGMMVVPTQTVQPQQQRWHHKGFAGLVLVKSGDEHRRFERIGLFFNLPPRPFAMSAPSESPYRFELMRLFNALEGSEEAIFEIS